MKVEILSPSIFNTEKTDYRGTSLFLGESSGLFDTVNRNHPRAWELYKTMKSLDWDELEFDYSSCNREFKELPSNITQKMIKSLAWQWEADSVAARSVSHIVSLYDPCSEVWAAWQRISDNEVVHASTYSEIVRSSFDDARAVLENILAMVEAMQRLSVVGRELKKIRERGLQYALGLVPNDQETYNHIFMFAFIMYCLERIQFMASFAVTFALGQEGHFMPICKAVQKITQDEYEVHVEFDKWILETELKTERGQIAYSQCRETMSSILNEIIASELTFKDVVFEDGENLRYLNKQNLERWILFSGTNVARPLKLDMNYEQVENNPLHYMKSWTNISDTQGSPQEEAVGQYKVNLLSRDDDDVMFAVDF